jgi:uncharacterized 2Fe-2S/4Fe-4S cluster protein (DUF4445 family)
MKKGKNHKPKKKKQAIGPPPAQKSKRKTLWLNVLPDDLWIKVRRGKTIFEALQGTDTNLEGDCGGIGKCGKCKVKVLSSIGEPPEEAREFLSESDLKEGYRLACQTKIKKDLTIYLGEPDPGLEYFQILKTGHRPMIQLDPLLDKRPATLPPNPHLEGISDVDRIKLALAPENPAIEVSLHCLRSLPEVLKKTDYHGAAVIAENKLLAWQNFEEVGRRYGLVFDLGTSTLVGKLISLLDGSEICSISRMNSQYKYGSNIISRLQFVAEHKNGLQWLHTLLIKDLTQISARLLEVGGLKAEDVFVAVAAGNTVMQHFLLNLNPVGIAGAPFSPVLTDGYVARAADVDLKLHPEALLYVMPAKSGYIGGDLISCIIASGAAERDDRTVLGLDLGTNGEIFLGNRVKMLTCSAAAGPALEGAKISHGMIARAGAIESVRIEEDGLHYQIIGNVKPKGLCGSGLVDLVAVLLHCRIIDETGLIGPTDVPAAQSLNSRLVDRGGVYDFLIASRDESYDGQPLYLTQKDVRELQLAKAAVAAGIEILIREMGIGLQDLHRVDLAGALGNYINHFSALRVGLLPIGNPEMINSLGNAASTGVSMVLLSKPYWHRSTRIAQAIHHVELSSRLDFNELFIEHMDFPRENLW